MAFVEANKNKIFGRWESDFKLHEIETSGLVPQFYDIYFKMNCYLNEKK